MCFIDTPTPIDWKRAAEVMKLRGMSLKDYPEFQAIVDAYIESKQHKDMTEYKEKVIRLKGLKAGNKWYKDHLKQFLTIVEIDRGPYTVVLPSFLVGILTGNDDWSKNPICTLWKKQVGEYLDQRIPKETNSNN
jgi:hypothetical protein